MYVTFHQNEKKKKDFKAMVGRIRSWESVSYSVTSKICSDVTKMLNDYYIFQDAFGFKQ